MTEDQLPKSIRLGTLSTPDLCHKCGAALNIVYIKYGDEAKFHLDCFSRYDHYYGLDRPID